MGPGPERLPEDDGMRRNSPAGVELAQHEEKSKGWNRTRTVHDDGEETSEQSQFGVLSAKTTSVETTDVRVRSDLLRIKLYCKVRGNFVC